MKVLVTGGSGQVGKEINELKPNWVYITSDMFDLTNCEDVENMYKTYEPDVVIHLAAKVGGILDNIKLPSEYFSDNILMNTLLVNYAKKFGVDRFIGILSTCIYPDNVKTYPMKEEYLHDGPPTRTNFSYGIAKRGMSVHIDAMNKQHGTNYCYLTPCNLYGVHDKFDGRSHFVAALIKKIYEAKRLGEDKIRLFGTGTPLRQFMNAKDFGRIIVSMVDNNINKSFNVATQENISIDTIARIALKSLDCEHMSIEYDSTKPDGQYRKDVDTTKFINLFPDFKFIKLEDGIREVFEKVFLK